MSDHPPHPAAPRAGAEPAGAAGPPATGPAPGSAPAGAGNGTPPKRYLCPYCGEVTGDARRCSSCGGHLDPLSRQATQNTMGPWQIHDAASPFRPGCSFATVRKLIGKGQITRRTVLRGPTTRQFWTFADRTPSVANLLGVCHNCHAEVAPEAFLCAACGASFTPETDRQYLGLAPRRPLPGEAPADQVAHLASDGPGLYGDPRRRDDEADTAAGGPGDGHGPRIQRPAFPADPRPARQKRSALAVIAIVAVAGAIGLSLGAAGALAVAWSVGMIDLAADDEAPVSAGAAQPAPSGPEEPPAAGAEQSPEAGGTPAGAEGADGVGPEAPGQDPAPDAAGAEPDPAEAPPEAGPAPALPEPAPAVPPRLRRLP